MIRNGVQRWAHMGRGGLPAVCPGGCPHPLRQVPHDGGLGAGGKMALVLQLPVDQQHGTLQDQLESEKSDFKIKIWEAARHRNQRKPEDERNQNRASENEWVKTEPRGRVLC